LVLGENLNRRGAESQRILRATLRFYLNTCPLRMFLGLREFSPRFFAADWPAADCHLALRHMAIPGGANRWLV